MKVKEREPWDCLKPATRLPWHCVDWTSEFQTSIHDEDNRHVCTVYDADDAAYIVEAANRYVSMCMAVDRYESRVRRFARLIAKYNELYGTLADFKSIVEEAMEIAKEDRNGEKAHKELQEGTGEDTQVAEVRAQGGA